jgi:hypothetical protein
MVLKTGDEYRYAEAMHDTSSAERWLLEKTRIKSATESTRTKFNPILGKDRVYAIDQFFYEITIGCAGPM